MKKLVILIIFILLSSILFDFIAHLFKIGTDLTIGSGILLIFGYLIVLGFLVRKKIKY